MAGARAPAARRRAADARRRCWRSGRAPNGAPRLPVPVAGGAARARRLAGRVARRDAAAAARRWRSTALTVCFLWLERLPLRPGLGVAALLALALAGALPLAAAADRGEPWFDYRSFAEGLGPDDPVRFDWGHETTGRSTGRATAPRSMRVEGARGRSYWKARTLDEFDGSGWTDRGYDRGQRRPDARPARPSWSGRRCQDASRSPCGACAARRGRRRHDDRGARREPADRARRRARAVAVRRRAAHRRLLHGAGLRAAADHRAARRGARDVTVEHMEDLSLRVHLRDDLTPAELDALPDDIPRSPIDERIPDSATSSSRRSGAWARRPPPTTAPTTARRRRRRRCSCRTSRAPGRSRSG